MGRTHSKPMPLPKQVLLKLCNRWFLALTTLRKRKAITNMLLKVSRFIYLLLGAYPSKVHKIRLTFLCLLLSFASLVILLTHTSPAVAYARSLPLQQAATPAPTVTPAPTPTPQPTATPQPTPTPVGRSSQNSDSGSTGPTTILIFFAIFVLASLLAVFVSTRRVGRRR